MLNARTISLLAAVLMLASASYAQAEPAKGTIQLNMVVEKEVVVTNAEGQPETKRVAAAEVVPNDKVVYTIRYQNTGVEEAENVYITNPVPKHMQYLNATAEGENVVITFSVDGGEVFDLPQNLTVPTAEGGLRKATTADYTHIRWTLRENVPAKATGTVSFWAQLE